MLGRARIILAAAAALALAAGRANALCEKPAAVRFAAGASSAEVSGGIARGDRDCFTLGARGGQTLIVTQPVKNEGNIVFQLYRPPWKIDQGADGTDIGGQALKGAEDGADAREWSGKLPVSGVYLLVIGVTRGGGDYRIRIEIK
jgi:hypothetical protein